MLAAISTCDIISKQNDLENLSQINEQKISIYPNPSKDFVTINWSKKTISMVSLVSLDGKILKRQSIDNITNEIKIDLSGLSDGIYQLLITENNDSKLYKIVKN